MTLREEALAAIDAERDKWERLVADVGEARLTEPIGGGEWTFKDLAAHLNGWTNNTVNRLRASAMGEPEPTPAWPGHLTGDDEINDWMYEESKEAFASEVLQERSTIFVRLHELVAMLPEDDLSDPARFPSLEGKALAQSAIDGSFFNHFHEEHEPEIRAWLEADAGQ